MNYEPTGKVKLLIDAMRADPRIWTSPEAAKVMGVSPAALGAYLDRALREQVIYRRLASNRLQYCLSPFPADAPAPGAPPAAPPAAAPAYRPPQMRAPRPGTELPRTGQVSFADGVAVSAVPLPAAASAPAAAAPASAPPPAPEPEAALPVPPAPPAAADTQAPCEPQAPAAEPEAQDDLASDVPGGEGDAFQPDAFISCRTGEIVLVGIEPDEEGRVTIPADLVELLRRQLAWSPTR